MQLKKNSQIRSLIGYIKSSWDHMSSQYNSFLKSIGVFVLGIFILLIINRLVGGVSHNLIKKYGIEFSSFVTIRIIYLTIAYIITLGFISFVQAIWIRLGLEKITFEEAYKESKRYFKKFFGLIIVITLLTGVTFLPTYGIVLVYFSQPEFLNFLIILLSSIQLIFILIACFWLIWAPYEMIEKKSGIIETLKNSAKNAFKNKGSIFIHLVTFFIILTLLQIARAFVGLIYPDLADIVYNLFTLLLLIPFITTFFGTTYKSLAK